MKLQIFVLACSVLIIISCGSNKKVVRNTNRKVLESPRIDDSANMKEISPIELPELQQVEKKAIVTSDKTQAYIYKFAPIAIKEMHKYKIPASITLAQGVLESGSGRSPLAIRSNNHFGIKCHRGWKGKSVTHDDDEIGECFRKYKYPEVSYEDHSKFLTSRKRYANLFKLKATDYKGWAYGLKKAGYATDRKYPNKLIAIIKKYNLHKYDLVEYDTNSPVQKEIEITTGHQPIYKVKKGDTLYSIARRYKISVVKLKEINGLQDNVISIDQELLVE